MFKFFTIKWNQIENMLVVKKASIYFPDLVGNDTANVLN